MDTTSSRYVKMTALEGTFSPIQNMVSFSIPSGMKLDLSECSVLIDLQVNTTTTNTGPSAPLASGVQYGSEPAGGSIYREAILPVDGGTANVVLPNVYYVKNADIRCERVGAIETLRAVNTLRLGLDLYENDLETKLGNQYLGGGNSDGIGSQNASCFRDINRTGQILSRNRSGQIRIPLKHIFDVAHTPVWDTTKYGRTDIKLEMAFDRLQARQAMGATDATWTNAVFNYDALDAAAPAALPADVLSLKTTRTYDHPEEESPFYVGQRLTLNFTLTNNGGAPQAFTKERTITGIIYNEGNDNKIQISFDDPIKMVANDVMTALTCVGVDAATETIIYNKVELEMLQVEAQTPSSIEYTTYTTEEDSGFGNAATNLNRQYTCEPDADTLVVCALGVPAGNPVNNPMNPTIRINSSRITIDSKDETTEPVVAVVPNGVGQANPLYFDRIDRAFMNMGDDLECLVEKQYLQNRNLGTNPAGDASVVINPLPLKAQNKQVQLNLDYTAGEVNILNLYKRMTKTI